jgi:acetyl esterase/lipase/DNA-binding beta-propeller fold protein YncE
VAWAVSVPVGSADSFLGTGPAEDPLEIGIGSPRGIAVGPKGDIYVASPERGRVFEIARDGKLRSVAFEVPLRAPTGLVVDGAGNLYVSDAEAGRVYRVGASTRRTLLVAGSGTVLGDDGPATAARLVRPTGLALTKKGDLLIADAGDHRVRRVDRDGRIHTVAGDGHPGHHGDGGPGSRARLSHPEAVAVDARGNVYIVDRGNNRVRRVANKSTTVSTIGAGGLGSPSGLAVDPARNLWIADGDNHRLVKVDRWGVAAGGWSDPTARPGAIAWEPGRGLLFADAARRLVLRVSHARAEPVAGNGASGEPEGRDASTAASAQEPTGPPPDLPKRRVVYTVPGMEQVRVRRDLAYGRDEPTLEMDLYLPGESAPARGWPVVVLVHGGPIPAGWAPKEWGVFRSYGELLAASGLAAVTFNHRLNAPADYPRAADDVAALLAHVRAEARSYEIDPERVAVWAFSGGGPLLASVLAGRPPYVRAAVSYYAFLGPPSGSPPEPRLSGLEQVRPGSAALPPLLIARAGRDDAALNASVDAFVTAALDSGVDLEVLAHPRGRHAFDILDDDERSRAVIRRTVAFLRESLGER